MIRHRMPRHRPLNPLDVLAFILNQERRSSVLLIVAAVTALVLANSGLATEYFSFFERTSTIGTVTMDIRHWVNEGLMVLFFLIVSLEVKREFIDGELNTWRQAAFPIVAAIGGMIMPAFIFALFNPYPPQSLGWGIPMATDIAVAIGALTLLSKRIPNSLRIFLLSLAIIDDIGSIVVINLFYSKPTNLLLVLCALGISLSLLAIRKQQRWPLSFTIVGIALWYCLISSGISGTLTGVILAALMPLSKRRHSTGKLQLTESIEDTLIPVTTFIVVPLFVFANAGVHMSDLSTALSGTGISVFMGIVLGMVIGKPLGIIAAGWLAQSIGIAHKPSNVSWAQILGTGCLAGIGFTVSLLVTNLAYPDDTTFRHAATAGIFTASLASGACGLGILYYHWVKVTKTHG